MEWTNLPTDFTDVSWNGLRKYQVIVNDDETVSFVDVTEYINAEKSYFSADDINATNDAINHIMGQSYVPSDMIAEEFSAESTYNIGDYVVYDNELYKFIAEHTGEWDDEDVTEVTVAEELGKVDDTVWGSITGTLTEQTDLKNALDAKANTDDLGDLASKDKVDYDTDIENKPELGDLASKDKVDYETDIDNLPELGDLASKDKVDYDTDIDNLPELGALADHDTVDYETEVENKPELGDLASKDKVDYDTDIDNLPTLGDLAEKDKVDYESDIDNLPTLGDLASKNKANWNTDLENVPQTFPPSEHNHDGRYYTKTETDIKLSAKANSADVYSKSQTNELLNEKFDKDPDSTLTGSILTFEAAVENAIKDLTVEINPVQDLHGYDAPWPAGGRKNMCDPSAIESGYYNNSGVYVSSSDHKTSGLIPVKASTTYTATIFDNSKTRIGNLVFTLWDSNQSIISQQTGSPVTTTAETAYVRIRNFDNQSSYITGNNYLYQLEEASSYTSFAPFSNVCPISGHSTATVTRTGKNLFDKTATDTTKGYKVNYYLNSSGEEVSFNGLAISEYLSAKPSITYTLSGIGGASPSICFYDINKTFISGIAYGGNSKITVISPVNCAFIRLTVVLSSIDSMQLELSSSASSFEPYQGTSLTIDLDGTRYGGTLNVLTGEMTVTKGIISDLSQLTWIQHGARTTAYYATSNTLNLKTYNNMISSALKGVSASTTVGNMPDNSVRSDQTADNYIYVNSTIASNVPSFTASMSGVQLVYELATPVTIQLSPAQISTLIGQNHLWCDSGDSTIILRTGAGKMAYQDSVSYSDLTEKPDPDDYYTKSEVESLINHSGVVAEKDASGSIAEFETLLAENLSALKVAIEPVQDLHGYEAPYPAGGGKNLLPKGTSKTETDIAFTVNEDGIVTVTGTATSTRFWGVQFTIPAGTYILNGCPSGGGQDSYLIDIRNGVGGSGISGISGDTGSGSTFTLTESLTAYVNIRIASGYACPTGGVKLSPMIRLSSVSDATFAPYSNVCPISGHSTATVTRTGKNLVDITKSESGGIDSSGTEVENLENWRGTEYIPVTGGLSYVLSTTIPIRRIYFYDENKNFIFPRYEGSYDPVGATAPANAKYARWTVYTETGMTEEKALAGEIQLEQGSTATTWTAYQPIQQITISLGSTVYGGTLNVLTGTLTVTHGMETFSSAPSNSWGVSAATSWRPKVYMHEINSMSYGAFQSGISNWLKTLTSWSATSKGIVFGDASNNRIMYLAGLEEMLGISDLAGLSTYLASNPLTVIYPLATPTVIRGLTPAQVQALVGKNYVWSDTGDVELSYYDNDTEEAINDTKQLVADYTETMVAPRNLTANEFVIVNKRMYKVTANVASGSNLVIGTNVVETTVAEQLTYLLSQL